MAPLSFDDTTGGAAAAADSANIMPEVISQHQRMVLGARFQDFNVQEIPVADAVGFAAMAEGAIASDENGWFRSLGNQRVYFATLDALATELAALEDRFARMLKPVLVRTGAGETLPLAPADGYGRDQAVVFVGDGQIENQDILSGTTGYVKYDIPANQQVMLADLDLVEPGSNIPTVPEATTAIAGIVKLADTVPTDGSATEAAGAPNQRAVSDALIGVQQAANDALAATRDDLQGKVEANIAALALAGSDIADNAAEIQALKDAPPPIAVAQETVDIGNGADQVIQVPLSGTYKNIISQRWEYAASPGTYAVVPQQDGQCDQQADGSWMFTAAFASPPPAGMFRVTVSGVV